MKTNPNINRIIVSALAIAAAAAFCGLANAAPGRTTLSLDGTWQIAEGKMDQAPAVFERTCKQVQVQVQVSPIMLRCQLCAVPRENILDAN